ncbi:allophanate hydrolase [Variovorax sp. YR216]|uniref:allophanate hydrolase n=1 Tax=Variovorax sp. YR216 TaxID=1882828 RepID=UPI0008945BBF|nr:allophanate hydrolase [Variovorax sp. YR216]SEB26071.1 allophanate hydrolase [Variovorax sp. YR216]
MMVHEQTDDAAGPAWITRLASPVKTAASGPLAGLRFAAKDNIDVAGVPTTAACPAFSRTPVAHATVVQRLLDAGALLLGKTNLDQFACGLNGTRSPYGAVPNSFDARYVSGGSSSGSAVVVAKGEADFSLGTDTAGSGRVPAGLNNIVGIKPSRGLVSARGVVPAAQSVDCVSIFARTVDVAARVLEAAMGFDAGDPYSRGLALATQPLPANFRFGVPSVLRFFGDVQAQRAFAQAIEQMRALGGTPVEIDYAPLAEAASLLYESALVAERYAAVREFFDAHETEVIEPVRGILAQGRDYSAADFVDARVKLQALAQRAAALWDGIDVLLVPTAPTHYTIEAMRADPVALNRNLGEYTNFVNLLDYAAISVPASIREDGLPFGITIIGPCGSDFQLAELGQRFHHSTGLPLGATGEPMPAPQPLPIIAPAPTVRVAMVGAHLSGMPLNGQLIERGARLLRATHTAPQYRLYALPGTVPPKPGLLRVPSGEGAAIAVEIWEMPLVHYGSFVALIPAPLGIGSLTLADGSSVQGFLCEALAVQGAEDITHHGGWRAYIASRATQTA